MYHNQALALKQMQENSGDNEPFDVKEYLISKIHSSQSKLYCQIPFRVCQEPCIVADLRSDEEVIGQLTRFVAHGDIDDCWISHRSRNHESLIPSFKREAVPNHLQTPSKTKDHLTCYSLNWSADPYTHTWFLSFPFNLLNSFLIEPSFYTPYFK